MKPFAYCKPGTLPEVFGLLSQYGKEAALLAGGTDLLVDWKKGLRSPRQIIDLKGLSSLEGLATDDRGNLHIGSLTTMDALSHSPLLEGGGWNLLAQAASKVGSQQIRNRATIGGNICRSSPSGDTLPPLLCLEATFRLIGPRGERQVPAQEFFLGPGKNALQEEEILAEIILPPFPSGCRGIYKKFSLRKAMDLAVVGVAMLGHIDPRENTFSQISIALGAVSPTPIRARKAEEYLRGAQLEPQLIEAAGRRAREEAFPISDLRGSEWYRKELIEQLVQEAVRELAMAGDPPR
jgi:carbon-monoxide dehydrogenase medium subunit